MAVTAHELGHVQQHQTGSGLMKLRSALVPALRFSPALWYICILLGLIMGLAGLFYLGIFFFGLMVIFTIMTVPVEFDASRRAFRLLDEAGLLVDENDRQGARSMLNAAGLTYVAAAVTSICNSSHDVSLANRQ